MDVFNCVDLNIQKVNTNSSPLEDDAAPPEAIDLEGAKQQVAGTARSMGIKVQG